MAIASLRRHSLLPLNGAALVSMPFSPRSRTRSGQRCTGACSGMGSRAGRMSRVTNQCGRSSSDTQSALAIVLEPMADPGSIHIDIAEVQTVEGKLFFFLGIDRASKFVVTQLVKKADRKTAWEFLEHLLKAVPCRIHTIVTDNGIQFAEQPRNRNTASSRQMRFDMICEGETLSAIGPRSMVERDRAPACQAEPSLEFRGSENDPGDRFPEGRPGRADEPREQGG